MITAKNLQKTFYVHKKPPGLWGSVKSLVKREKIAKRAVKGVDLHVGEGEIVGLIGANGAGKTTLVKMLAGIVHPTGGDADVLGFRPWERKNDFRRQIALIMGQKAQLWWDLPAADCFLLLREIYQIPNDVYAKRLDHLADVLGVSNEINIQIRRLSLGERMKMELIAALLHAPRVVYLDEPTIGLDISAQRAIRDFILQYREEHRPAMILTSHYMEDIERLCERIVIIREGEFVYEGGLREVVERYAPNKDVIATWGDKVDHDTAAAKLAEMGEVVEATETGAKLRVPRSEVAKAAGRLLESFPVADLAIEEVEIGRIIERIMMARGGDSSPSIGEDGPAGSDQA